MRALPTELIKLRYTPLREAGKLKSGTWHTRAKTGGFLSTTAFACYTTFRVNDPSAGSPTETLLRLLLPLDDQVCPTSRIRRTGEPAKSNNPWTSLNHPIGSSDGRCVQRAGT